MLTDLRRALRSLTHRPALTVLPLLSLLIGIGATTGVFSVVHAVLLRPLPYPDADRLVRVFEVGTPAQGGDLRSIAIPTLADWRRHVRLFEDIALYGATTFDLTEGGGAERVDGAIASASLFAVLGVSPASGRVFTSGEEQPGTAPVVVLSHGLWHRRFGGAVDVLGRTIRLNRRTFTVVGVMPAGFAYPAGAELWTSLAIDDEYDARGARHLSGLARLRPGVSLAAATADLLAAEQALAQVYPQNYAERGVRLIPLDERIVGGVRPALFVLAGAVLLVLLMACVNAANLLLARAIARRRDIAIAVALGAGRARLARQVLLEALALFVTAGLMGLALAAAIVQSARRLSAEVLPRAETIELHWPAVLFAVVVAGACGMLFGLVPVWQTFSVSPAASLLEGRRGTTGGRAVGRLRSALVVAQTAMAALLLVGAGLLVRSLQELNHVDAGLEVANVLTFDLSAPPAIASERDAVIGFFREVRDRTAAIPGVRGVALASRLPLSGADHSGGFRRDGEPVDPAREHSAQDRAVSAGFFRALGIPLLRGREFTDADHAGSSPVVVVNQAFVTQYFPTGDAVGQRIIPTRAGGVSREIVGIVGDTRQFALDRPALPEFYIPHAQDPWPFLAVAVRTTVDPASVLSEVRAIVAAIDPDLPLGNVQGMADAIATRGARRQLAATILGAFAVVAYGLAAFGLYGVVASTVAARTSEIGIRVALGASRSHVVRLAVTRGAAVAAVGVLTGLAAAVPLTRALRGLLFGVGTTDPFTFGLVGVLVTSIAVLAAIVPTLRALRVDPARALRGD
jgi:predicted permease